MAVENDEEPLDGTGVSDIPSKKVTAYQSLKRNLSEDELSSPGTLKLMLHEIDRQNEEILRLEKFKDNFYRVDKEKAVLEQKLFTELSNELLYTVTITLGAALLGLCPAMWQLSTEYGMIDLAVSIILLIIGLISKFRGKLWIR